MPLFSFFCTIYDISVEKVRSEWITAAGVDVAVALVAEGAVSFCGVDEGIFQCKVVDI